MSKSTTHSGGDGVSLVQPWFQRPEFEDEIDGAGLSGDEKALARQLRTEGFAIVDLLGDKDDSFFDAFIKSLGEGYLSSGRATDLWKKNSFVRDLACHQRILDLLAKFYGREPFPFQTLNFPRGSEQLAHSDTIHFNCVLGHFMCGVWVALQDVTTRNGPLVYYPGSHNLPVYSLSDIGVVGSLLHGRELYSDKYEPFIQHLVKTAGLAPAELEIKRGQALIWAANLLHGGSPILDKGSTRHSQVTHYYFHDCAYYTPFRSDLMLKKILYRNPYNILTGRRVRSTYFGRKIPFSLVRKLVELKQDYL